MKKLYPLLFISVLIYWGCEDKSNDDDNDKNVDEIVFNLEPRLDQDVNGYYHLELNPSSFQTLHRLSGHTYLNGEPLDVMKFNWESSHFWMLGDTLGYFIHRGLTDDLEYVSYDTTYMIGFNDFVVPTINCCSYSNSDGEVNTMFSPVWTMRYDTIRVTVEFYDIIQSFEIVLD